MVLAMRNVNGWLLKTSGSLSRPSTQGLLGNGKKLWASCTISGEDGHALDDGHDHPCQGICRGLLWEESQGDVAFDPQPQGCLDPLSDCGHCGHDRRTRG